jgi:hypothetical protein
METTLLRALNNLSAVEEFTLTELYSGQNRINNVGAALEYFVKDLFCSTMSVQGLAERDLAHSNYLSYLGNQNNPPDFIIKNSDAVEVKKIGGLTGDIQLNSSYPKAKLYRDDVRIKQACRNSDGGRWEQKDLIYCVGTVAASTLKVMWFVYGTCYAAHKDVYEKTLKTVRERVRVVDDLDFVETNEIAGLRRVDPLGITYLRVRGMWGIDTPHSVFGHLTAYNKLAKFSAFALVPDERYEAFAPADRLLIEENPRVEIKNVKIKSPDNPAQYMKARLITITK